MCRRNGLKHSKLAPVLEESVLGRDTFSGLVLLLMYETQNAHGFWTPFFKVLPHKFDTPLFWPDNVLHLIKDTPLYYETIELKTALRNIYNREIQPLQAKFSDLLSEMDWSFDRFCWSISTVWNRAYWIDEVSATPGIVPLADMMNHWDDSIHDVDDSSLGETSHPTHETSSQQIEERNKENSRASNQPWSTTHNLGDKKAPTAQRPKSGAIVPPLRRCQPRAKSDYLFDDETRSFRVTSGWTFLPGREVFTCYGRKDNETLLADYAFIIPNLDCSPSSRFSLDVSYAFAPFAHENGYLEKLKTVIAHVGLEEFSLDFLTDSSKFMSALGHSTPSSSSPSSLSSSASPLSSSTLTAPSSTSSSPTLNGILDPNHLAPQSPVTIPTSSPTRSTSTTTSPSPSSSSTTPTAIAFGDLNQNDSHLPQDVTEHGHLYRNDSREDGEQAHMSSPEQEVIHADEELQRPSVVVITSPRMSNPNADPIVASATASATGAPAASNVTGVLAAANTPAAVASNAAANAAAATIPIPNNNTLGAAHAMSKQDAGDELTPPSSRKTPFSTFQPPPLSNTNSSESLLTDSCDESHEKPEKCSFMKIDPNDCRQLLAFCRLLQLSCEELEIINASNAHELLVPSPPPSLLASDEVERRALVEALRIMELQPINRHWSASQGPKSLKDFDYDPAALHLAHQFNAWYHNAVHTATSQLRDYLAYCVQCIQ